MPRVEMIDWKVARCRAVALLLGVEIEFVEMVNWKFFAFFLRLPSPTLKWR